jgi:hypothetical protein
MRALFVALFTVSMTAAAAAQWIQYPTAAVPRLPNGTVNLNAPAPKAPGGRPDFLASGQVLTRSRIPLVSASLAASVKGRSRSRRFTSRSPHPTSTNA